MTAIRGSSWLPLRADEREPAVVPVAPPLCPCCGRPLEGQALRVVEEMRGLLVGGELRRLSPMEWDIFSALRAWPGHVVVYERLAAAVYRGEAGPPGRNVLHVVISRLRKALAGTGWAIRPIWGEGVRLELEDGLSPDAALVLRRNPGDRGGRRRQERLPWVRAIPADEAARDPRPDVPGPLASDDAIAAAFGKGSFA